MLVLLAMALGAVANDYVESELNPWKTSTPYVKAMKAIEDNETELANKMFAREVKSHPKNGYALYNWGMHAAIHEIEKEYILGDGKNPPTIRKTPALKTALSHIEQGIDLMAGSDAAAACKACLSAAEMMEALHAFGEDRADSIKMTHYKERAFAIHPCDESFDAVGQLKYDGNSLSNIAAEINTFYQKCPTNENAVAMMALLKNENGDYEKVIEIVDHLMKLKSDSGETISSKLVMLKASALKHLGRHDEAADIALQVISDPSIEGFADAPTTILQMAADAPEVMLMKLRQREFASQGNPLWIMSQGMVYRYSLGDHRTALPYFEKVHQLDPRNKGVLDDLAYCYYMTGDVEKALLYAEANDRMSVEQTKTAMLMNLGRYDEIIKERKNIIALSNFVKINEAQHLETLGKLYYLNGERDKALETINDALSRSDSLPQALYYKGLIARSTGDETTARDCLKKALDMASLIEQGELMVLRPMCLIELGNTSEAHEAINSLATACESDIASKPGNHDFLETNVPCYDIAAAYAMLGDSDNALKFLDLHFTHDYLSYNFGRLERDSRFDSLRGLPRFNQLVEKYLKKWKGEQ